MNTTPPFHYSVTRVLFWLTTISIWAHHPSLAFAQSNFSTAENNIPECRISNIMSPVVFRGGQCIDHSKSPLNLKAPGSDQPDGTLFNYSLLLDKKHSKEIESYGNKTTLADNRRALLLAEQARKMAIDYLTGGLPQQSWSKETKAMVLRINKLQFEIYGLSDAYCYDNGPIGYPQASYYSLEHTIGICMSLAKTPSNEILAAISHEIGHAVSTCSMKKPVLEVEPISTDNAQCILEKSGLGQDLDKDDLAHEINLIVRQFREIRTMVEYDESESKALIECGLATKLPETTMKEIMAFKEFDTCSLKRHHSDYERYVNRSLFHADELPTTILPHVQGSINKFKQENPEVCYRKTEESFADHFAAQVLAHHQKTENISSLQKIKFWQNSQYRFSALYCFEKQIQQALSNTDLYPSTEERLKTPYQYASVQDAFRCRSTAKTCRLPDSPHVLSQAGPSSKQPPSKEAGTTK